VGEVRASVERIGRCASDRVFVAEHDGQLLGVLALHSMPLLHQTHDVAWISALVVAQRARGQGVGRALVSVAEEAARMLGCARMAVTSAERRSDAHAFYLRLGYEHTGRRFVKPLG
jgi:GNAT superfamily N-acetyltransferase